MLPLLGLNRHSVSCLFQTKPSLFPALHRCTLARMLSHDFSFAFDDERFSDRVICLTLPPSDDSFLENDAKDAQAKAKRKGLKRPRSEQEKSSNSASDSSS